jgi:xanthine dehydrogenase YagS FAD-binding subunit
MRSFEWIGRSGLDEVLAAPFDTVADAMVTAADAPVADRAFVKAGGIDLLGLMKEDLVAPERIIDLRRLAGLDRIAAENGKGLRIGALATLAAVAGHPLVASGYPILAAAAHRSGYPQIRNVATIGGNLLQRPHCWYFRSRHHHCLKKGGAHCFALSGENQYHAVFDNRPCAIVHPSTPATALVALGAAAELRSAEGATRQFALEDFFLRPQRDPHRENDLKPNEILIALHLPALSGRTRMAYLKQGEKDAFDWPLAEVAVVLDLAPDGTCTAASVILGAAAPVPHRATAAERALIGRRVDQRAAGEAARAAVSDATPLAKNAYKLALFETLVGRAVLQAVAGG